MIFVVLLIICLILYIKVKKAEVMGSNRTGQSQATSRSRSKVSTKRQKSSLSTAIDTEDRPSRATEKRTQSILSSLQNYLTRSQRKRSRDNLFTAKGPPQEEKDPWNEDEFTGIPLTVRMPTPRLAYQDSFNPQRVQNIPPGSAPPPPPPQKVPTLPARSVTGTPATIGTPTTGRTIPAIQPKSTIPQNRMARSIDIPIKQSPKVAAPGVAARNIQSVTLM